MPDETATATRSQTVDAVLAAAKKAAENALELSSQTSSVHAATAKQWADTAQSLTAAFNNLGGA